MAFFQPLNILECELVPNPKSSMSSARNFASAKALGALRGSPAKNAISIFIAEVLYRSLSEGANESGLFDWCIKQIVTLDAIEGNYSNFHLYFLLEYASSMGFSPSTETLLPFMDSDASLMREFIRADMPQAMLIPLSGERRSEICAKILRYLEFHLEVPLNIRSLAILGELF